MLIAAHRGVRSLAPENSLAAFAKAKELGVPWVELDVQALGDGTLVVTHDLDLKRLFGQDRLLSQLSAADLESVRYLQDPSEQLPTLAQVLELLAAQGTHLNLELKADGPDPEAMARACLTLLDQLWPRHLQLVVSSFSWSLLEYCRQLRPQLDLGWLLAEPMPQDWLARAQSLGLRSIHPHWAHLSAYWLQAMRQAGFQCFTWTINEPERIASCWLWGLDMAISDWPQRFLSESSENVNYSEAVE